ncbi:MULTISPECIES: hypothetical protein [Agrobacterium]|uniref:Uncharacterized protein n=1 Tax=Agrobacterium larrymoorei TaxID=160699 RepID=A0AAJ2BJH8_9HYPH|nr:hypothetical protein [Agrobacterium larrymoorei]MDR6104136.1 hypothetical protein [Agrobacterium larrymoorei]
MRAPARSHGFDKPADLEDELAQLDEERADGTLQTLDRRPAPPKPGRKPAEEASLRAQIAELRRDLDEVRRDVEKLSASRNTPSRSASDVSNWLPVVRSVAITSLASRIFASSPMIALMVAAVPFALGLTAGSKQ